MAFTQAERIKLLAELYRIRHNTLSNHNALLNMAHFGGNMAQFGGNILPVQLPPPLGSGVYEDDTETPAEINLSIDTTTHITGDSNLVSIDAGTTASKIAMAIIGTLKQLTTDEGGIPMADINGQPRPITLEVKTPTFIQGAQNVVGERAIALSMFVSGARRRAEEARGNGLKKRERAGSEPLGVDPKRPKVVE